MEADNQNDQIVVSLTPMQEYSAKVDSENQNLADKLTVKTAKNSTNTRKSLNIRTYQVKENSAALGKGRPSQAQFARD